MGAYLPVEILLPRVLAAKYNRSPLDNGHRIIIEQGDCQNRSLDNPLN